MARFAKTVCSVIAQCTSQATVVVSLSRLAVARTTTTSTVRHSIVAKRMLPVLTQFAADRGVGVLLVEQHVHLALKSSSRAYVLNRGELTFSGTANALQNQRQFLESNYMGSTKQRE